MYVCLCNAVTSNAVQEAMDAGARTTKEVANMCGAGTTCGRCRHTVRAMLAANLVTSRRTTPVGVKEISTSTRPAGQH